MNTSNQHTTFFHCTVPLPSAFRARDMLDFHRRDAQELAERVEEDTLHKGLFWQEQPARLSISFQHKQACAELQVDGPSTAENEFQILVRHMLGLEQPIEQFESVFQEHHELGRLLRQNRGLRVPQTATPFEALSWAIIGQQISLSAAVSVRRKFIQGIGAQHSSGIWCFPDARRVAERSPQLLRESGLSAIKAQAILTVSQAAAEGSLPLQEWLRDPREAEIRSTLLAVRGIGPWTVDYALLRGYGCLDGSLHGDAAVRRQLQILLGRAQKISPEETREWLLAFAPWRALAAAHLWASPDMPAA